MERRSNKFKKAIHHLKSKQIDEKLELLNEIPTNNSAGIYVVEPEYQVQDPDVPGEVTREANFTQDALVNGRDTTGLFDVDGTTILTIEPPDALGDKSFILGPMASMWYSWGNFSTIGYIRQSDRRMVDLGRITGQLGSWNGTSGFTSYGQLLLNQAVWFRDTPKLNGADNNTPNYRAFYPGPPSNSPDQYGRYLCVITGTPKSATTTSPPRRVPPVVGGFDPNLPPGSAKPGRKKSNNKKNSPKSSTPKPSLSNMSAKDFSDYKNGGGDAALKSGKTVQQIIDQGKKNIGQYDSGSRIANPYTLTSKEKAQLNQIAKNSALDASSAKVDIEVRKLQNLDKIGLLKPQDKLNLLALQSYQGYGTVAKGAEVATDVLSTLMLAKQIGQIATKGVIKGLTSLVTTKTPGLSAATKSTIGSTGLDFKGFRAITQGKPYIPSNAPQVLGKGTYSSPQVGKSGGLFGGTGGAKYAGAQGSLGGAKTPGGVVQSVVPGGSPRIPFIEPQSKVTAKTFDKGAELARRLADPNYRSGSVLANKLRQQASQSGYKSGQTSIPYSELPKITTPSIPKSALATGAISALSQIKGSTPQNTQNGSGSDQNNNLNVRSALAAGALGGIIKINPSQSITQNLNRATNVADYTTIIQDPKIGLGKNYSFTDWTSSREGMKANVLRNGEPVMGPDGKPMYVTASGVDTKGKFTSHGKGQQTTGNNVKTIINQIKNITPATETGAVKISTTRSNPTAVDSAKSAWDNYKAGSGPKPNTGTQSSITDFLKKAGKVTKIIKLSYEPQGQVLSESRQRILRDIKKPYVLPEQPKVKYTFKPKVNRTINPDLMKKAEVPTSFKPAEERLWGKYEKEQNARFSQERKNEVLDHLGGSDHAWEYMTETSRNKNNDIMYGNFGDSKKKIVRKEELKGDTLLFIVDENGKKESILQSELSIEIANEYNKELFSNYFQEQETLQADKDPLFKKVSKRLKKEIEYDDKPSSKGYPNDPPPEMVNGWHPEYGNKSNYYNTLDPHSANSMPATGNAEIDAKVRRAKTLKRVLGKKA